MSLSFRRKEGRLKIDAGAECDPTGYTVNLMFDLLEEKFSLVGQVYFGTKVSSF
jgi:hypothetical protein